jgi:hypothetical protein
LARQLEDYRLYELGKLRRPLCKTLKFRYAMLDFQGRLLNDVKACWIDQSAIARHHSRTCHVADTAERELR